MPTNLSDLKPAEGSNRDRKRVGRGTGSGHGKTSGKGSKGQKARSGPGVPRWFEGGQLPIQKRMPYKRGFTNIWRAQWEIVNLDRLAELDLDEITPQSLFEAGVTRGLQFPVKILGSGEISKAVNISAHAFSEAAKTQIEGAGGSVTVIERTDRWTVARPRSRRLPLNREMKAARVGKSGGPSRSEFEA
jgi:large subunit ribosomal protein L15